MDLFSSIVITTIQTITATWNLGTIIFVAIIESIKARSFISCPIYNWKRRRLKMKYFSPSRLATLLIDSLVSGLVNISQKLWKTLPMATAVKKHNFWLIFSCNKS